MKTSIGIWIIDAHGSTMNSFAAHVGKNAIGIANPDATVVNALDSASRPAPVEHPEREQVHDEAHPEAHDDRELEAHREREPLPDRLGELQV